MILGLTGGIASGKSTLSNIFRELGIKIVDADKIAKDISEREDVLLEIKNIFGNGVFDKNGVLDRKKLKNKVFSDKSKLKKLNDIVHPKVWNEFKKIKEKTAKNDIIIFDVPLLFESGMDKMCDKVLLIYINKELQIKRMLERDGIDRELALKIINSQMSLEEKISKSHLKIENSGTIEDLRIKAKKIYEELKGELKL